MKISQAEASPVFLFEVRQNNTTRKTGHPGLFSVNDFFTDHSTVHRTGGKIDTLAVLHG